MSSQTDVPEVSGNEKQEITIKSFVKLVRDAENDLDVSELINEAIESQGIYGFSELLDEPRVKALKDGPYHSTWKTLNVFAYGNLDDYLKNRDDYISLSPLQIMKLDYLTFVDLARSQHELKYDFLMKKLHIADAGDLRTFLIDAIHNNVMSGKLDQKNSVFVMQKVKIQRDVRPKDIVNVQKTLENWSSGHIEPVMKNIEELVASSNEAKKNAIVRKKYLSEREDMVLSLKLQSSPNVGLKRKNHDDIRWKDYLNQNANSANNKNLDSDTAPPNLRKTHRKL